PSRTFVGDLAYSPYGAAYAGSGPVNYAGHWQDTPGNLDDSRYRLLAPAMARWLSPDPAGLAAVNPANPQTWNAYAYVANQPLEFTDPLGLGTTAGSCVPNTAGGMTCLSGPSIQVQASEPLPLGIFLLMFDGFTPSGPTCGCGKIAMERFIMVPVNRPNFGAAIDAADRAGRIFGQVALQTNFLTKPWFYVEWWSAAGAAASGALLAAAGGAEAVWGGVRALGPLVLGSAPAVAQGIREAQDFAAGWAGQYTPSWADTAGLVSHDIYQTITCPPGSGQCG
ncbi:MAG: RHS repeat-associated core domain-containing protein, partial [Terriglobales bacterium]